MDALIQVIDDWEYAIDHKKSIHAVFFDFQKAFDIVDHTILLRKLQKFNLPSWIIPWVAQYLDNRVQRVKIGEKISKWSPVLAGIVQGSVLGPTLFLLFIADLNERIDPLELIELIKYADDLLTYQVFIDVSENRIQQAVDAISNWANENKMRLNESKTQHMIVNYHQPSPINIFLNGLILKETQEYKYLGIRLNKTMRNDEHWNALSKKLSSNIFLFKQMKRLGFKIDQIVTSYKSINLSLIDYSAPLLISSPISVTNPIKQSQKRFLRIINCNPDEAKQKFNLLPIDQYIEERCKCILERLLKNKTHPTTLKLQNNNNQKTINTRSKFQFKAPIAKHERYNRSFVPKTLRALRDGISNKSATSASNAFPQKSTTNNSTNSGDIVNCPICHKAYKKRGIKVHLNSCKNKT